MDEVSVTNLNSYKNKRFVDISKEDLDLGMHTQSLKPPSTAEWDEFENSCFATWELLLSFIMARLVYISPF